MECTTAREIEQKTDCRRLRSKTQGNVDGDGVSGSTSSEENYSQEFLTITDDEEKSRADIIMDDEKKAPNVAIKAGSPKLLTTDEGNYTKISKIYKCNKCDATFTSTCSRFYHARYHLDIKPYVCPHLHCGKGFVTPFGLTVHAKIHQGLLPPTSYSCKLCSQSFCHLTLFDKHLNENHTDICLLCDKRYFISDDLLRHTITHSNQCPSCRACGEMFPRYAELRNHIKMCEVLHPCDVCKKQFPAESHLNKHMSIHWQHKCLPCGRNFASSTEHITHIRRVHKGHACQVCKQVFNNSFDLSRHQLQNKSNTMKDHCTICKQHFRTHCHLTDHLYPQGTIAPFACDECGVVFGYPCGLEVHRRIHSGKEPALLTPKKETHEDVTLDIQDEICVFVVSDDKIIYKAHKLNVSGDLNSSSTHHQHHTSFPDKDLVITKTQQEITQDVVLNIQDEVSDFGISDNISQYKVSLEVANLIPLKKKQIVTHNHSEDPLCKRPHIDIQQDVTLDMQNVSFDFVVSNDNSQSKLSIKSEEPLHEAPQNEIHQDLEILYDTCNFANARHEANSVTLKNTLPHHSTNPDEDSLQNLSHLHNITLEVEDDELLVFADSDDRNSHNASNGEVHEKNNRNKYITSFQKFIEEDCSLIRDPFTKTKNNNYANDSVQEIEIKEESLEESEEFVFIHK